MAKPYVICVDDEKIILVSLKDQLIDYLRENNYDYAFAQSGDEALEIIEEIQEEGGELALIISDYIMPKMKGDEVLIRASELAPDATRILLTGQADMEGVRNVINKAGLYRYIAKPWDASDLLLTVDQAIKSYLQKTQLDRFDTEIKLLNKLTIASREISVEHQLDTLYKKFVKHAAENTNAETLMFLVENEDKFRPYDILFFSNNEKQKATIQARLDTEKDKLASEIIEKAGKVSDKNSWQFATTLTNTKDSSRKHGHLIIENQQSKAPIEPKAREVLQMLVAQASLSIENARLVSALDSALKDVTDSIQYAQRIQFSLLPPLQLLRSHFPESYIFYRPKDVVSGDFYWFYEQENTLYVAAIDCTGHGVPGAFMSILCDATLKQIMLQYDRPDTDQVLTTLHAEITRTLNSGTSGQKINDGMDMTLCRFDFEHKTLQYSGAMNELFFIRKGVDTELLTDKLSIGHAASDEEVRTFHEINFEFMEGDTFYLFTDGIVDQFGGKQARKLGRKRFYDFLVRHDNIDLITQQTAFTDFMNEWQGNEEQTDDMLLIALRITT